MVVSSVALARRLSGDRPVTAILHPRIGSTLGSPALVAVFAPNAHTAFYPTPAFNTHGGHRHTTFRNASVPIPPANLAGSPLSSASFLHLTVTAVLPDEWTQEPEFLTPTGVVLRGLGRMCCIFKHGRQMRVAVQATITGWTFLLSHKDAFLLPLSYPQ